MNILFICTGNTCRSPLAEKILKAKAKEKGLDIEVRSAGIAAYDGQPASENTEKVLREYGLQYEHRSQKVNKDLLEWADIILTMTTGHKQVLLEKVPEYKEKIYTLKEYSIVKNNDSWERLNKLYNQVETKRKQFIEDNKSALTTLQKRRDELKQELEQVDLEINEFNRVLEDLVREELQEIEKIQNNLPSIDIEDPFGQDMNSYRKVAREIEQTIDDMINTKTLIK